MSQILYSARPTSL